jgi:hypothetical protein
MKFSNQFLPHVIVLALIIVAALICFVPCIQPYSRGSNFAAYEGFESEETNSPDANPIKEEEEKEEDKGNVESAGDSVESAGASVEPVSTEGFGGLFGNTFSNTFSGSVPKESFGGFLGNTFSGSVPKESFGGFLGNVGILPGKKTESFASLSVASSPVGNHAEVLDRFSQIKAFGVEGVNGCASSGLSNSQGYLCLTPELISALKTRGGNAGGSM